MSDASEFSRRHVLKTMAAIPLAASVAATQSQDEPAAPAPAPSQNHFANSPAALHPFDYRDVRLLPGRFNDQYIATRAFYLAVPNDDILHGYRARAGLPAPGKNLGGVVRRGIGYRVWAVAQRDGAHRQVH